MPIYEYACKKCGKTIEVIRKFSDPVLRKHQGCGGSLTKLISTASFQLKGTGWYVTDYARKGKSGDSESSSESAKDSSKENKESAPKSETSSKDSSKESSKESAKPAKKASKDSGKSSE
jgi:putative FmdB family regulatory protein